MAKKKRGIQSSNPQQARPIVQDGLPEKNNNLILGGILLAMSSIGLLIFVFSEKIFHLK
tara:strand:- start:971 stop:1147 length:177 start_codon:yes stop_codon:yes gene_type:complete